MAGPRSRGAERGVAVRVPGAVFDDVDLRLVAEVPRPEHLDRVERGEALEVVGARSPHVTGLRRHRARVLDGVLAHDRHREHREATGPQDPMDLGDRGAVVGDVLEDVGCVDDVVGPGLERRVGEVEVQVDVLTHQVRRRVLAQLVAEATLQDLLRRDVQHRHRREVVLFREPVDDEGLQPVPFGRVTGRAVRLGPAAGHRPGRREPARVPARRAAVRVAHERGGQGPGDRAVQAVGDGERDLGAGGHQMVLQFLGVTGVILKSSFFGINLHLVGRISCRSHRGSQDATPTRRDLQP